jgi:hypothetical protein
MAITEQRLGDGTQILPPAEGYWIPCQCGARLTWRGCDYGQNAADCECGMSYYATETTRVKIEGVARAA